MSVDTECFECRKHPNACRCESPTGFVSSLNDYRGEMGIFTDYMGGDSGIDCSPRPTPEDGGAG